MPVRRSRRMLATLLMETAVFWGLLGSCSLLEYEGHNFWWQFLILQAVVSGALYGFRAYDFPGGKEMGVVRATRGLFWGAVLSVPILMCFFPRIPRPFFLSAVLILLGSAVMARLLASALSDMGRDRPLHLVTWRCGECDQLVFDAAKKIGIRWFPWVAAGESGEIAGDVTEKVDFLLLGASNPATDLKFKAFLEKCRDRCEAVVFLPDFVESALGRIPIGLCEAYADHYEMAFLKSDSPPFQRLLNIGLAIGVGLFFLPLALLVAFAVFLGSGRPVFFSQDRVGLNGNTFRLYKFRTMREGKVTLPGKFLRRMRLDELPQIWNVLLGDMNLIGPRPEVPELVALYDRGIPFYRLRHRMKPGITGWAQVNMGYAENISETAKKLEYDLYYIKNRTLGLDLQILLKTMECVLGMRGGR